MRTTFLLLFMLCFQFSFAQLQKKTWLLGGNASFERSEYKNDVYVYNSSKSSDLEIAPNIGYFFWDKLALGLRGSLDNIVSKSFPYPSTTEQRTRLTTWGVGPFVRYYFLPQGKPVNLFTDANGQYILSTISTSSSYAGKSLSVTGGAGAALFMNKVIALEFLMAYRHTNTINSSIEDKSNHLQFKVGFQIHFKGGKQE